MLVCITAPPDDPAAKEMAERFSRDGFASFGAKGVHMGFVQSVHLGEGGYLIMVDVNEPELEEYLKGIKGKKQPDPDG
jgi:hypothetical protein